jgi:hypothetical protein
MTTERSWILAKLFPSLRPYWHVDLKWIVGILLFFTLGAALLFYNLAGITERERATTMSATIIASLFSKNGLDDDKDIVEFRQQAASIPGDIITPVPQYPWLKISKHDLMTKSPREIRITIFRNLTDPIYDKGLVGASAEFSADPVNQKQFQKDATLLGVFTKTTHEMFQTAFTWSAVATFVFFVLLLYFSAGWGRLVSPAIVLLAVSPLGTVLGLLLLYPPTDGDAPLAALPTSVSQEIGSVLNQSYVTATIVGVVLIFVAGLGKLVQTIVRRRKASSTKSL